MSQLAVNHQRLEKAGFAFDPWWASVGEYEVLEVGRNSSFPLHPAHYWTHVDTSVGVDFIGKVESFESDFHALCKHVKINPSTTDSDNVDVSPITDGQGYKSIHSMSRASIDRINQLFRKDFDLFGYGMV